MKQFICIICLVIVPNLSYASSIAQRVASRDAAATEYVNNYLSILKKEKIAVFYNECRLKNGGKVGVIIPIGRNKGLYVENSSYNTVANTADVIWNDGKWQKNVAQGGVYTITRANYLIDELIGGAFRFVSPGDIGDIMTSKPNKMCIEKQVN